MFYYGSITRCSYVITEVAAQPRGHEGSEFMTVHSGLMEQFSSWLPLTSWCTSNTRTKRRSCLSKATGTRAEPKCSQCQFPGVTGWCASEGQDVVVEHAR
eukprot:6692590-Prymnesium_polylepis.1